MTNKTYKSADVEKTSDTSVTVRRSFTANKDLVYKAFTTPALLKRWMLGPPGWEIPICEMDVKEGGGFRWYWKNQADGSQFGFTGMFRQVLPLQKFVNTQTFDPGTLGGDMGNECLITVTFSEADGVTTVATKIDYQSKADLEKAVNTGMTDGMEMSYQSLDRLIKNPNNLGAANGK